jgi:hypothetical protein
MSYHHKSEYQIAGDGNILDKLLGKELNRLASRWYH